jgi:putative transposase
MYHFVVAGYVVMPEHVHLLISEPDRGDPSLATQAIKQSFAQRLRGQQRRSGEFTCGPVWLPRFYDFVVWNPHKRPEKLNYMHDNPVRRGLVSEPGEWRWSSYRFYAYDESGPVLLNEQKPAVMTVREGSLASKLYQQG